MSGWTSRHWIGISAWILSISWLFHIYLLTGAAFRGDVEARNWEFFVTLLHIVLLLALCVASYHQRNSR